VAQTDYIYLNGRPMAVLNGSTIYYLHDDMLGTPQVATDSNQNTQWQASYDSFGQASVSGTVTQNLRFPSQYFDVESGWNHNGFRDYAPTLGRYIEPDPLGRLGSGNNLYVYVNDDPVDFIDPLGLCKKICDELLSEIKQLRNEVAERVDQYNNPKYNIPLFGKMSRQGHIQKIEEAQGKLRNALNEYNSQGCPGSGLPADAWSLATMPAPTLSPSPSHLPLPPWAKAGIGVGIGVGVGAGIIILCPKCIVLAPVLAF